MIYEPRQTAIRHALMALFRDHLNDQLALAGQSPLPESAFLPVAPGPITGDLISVTYAAGLRAKTNEKDLRLTSNTRDNVFGYALSIWCFGATDDEAQSRAEACEFAITQLLDRDDHQYLGGLLDNPILIGDTEPIPMENEEGTSLIAHLTFPVLCRARTTRPELIS